MPMERAVPAIDFIAVSTLAAFMSFSLAVAISRTCFFVTLPTKESLLVAPEPFSIFAALRAAESPRCGPDKDHFRDARGLLRPLPGARNDEEDVYARSPIF